MKRRTQHQLVSIVIAGGVMILGLFFLKFIPMLVWGNDIRFDASFHITATCFILYVLWYFIDQNKHWRIPFFALSTAIIFFVGVQRLFVSAHNDVGLALGLILSFASIAVSRWDYYHGKIEF